ncbi:MAG: hypothetical protein HY301_03285 [Verrucomicrobia bacterium]|nr:hypothetical protein [Verrucomicrobiota bacterium]
MATEKHFDFILRGSGLFLEGVVAWIAREVKFFMAGRGLRKTGVQPKVHAVVDHFHRMKPLIQIFVPISLLFLAVLFASGCHGPSSASQSPRLSEAEVVERVKQAAAQKGYRWEDYYEPHPAFNRARQNWTVMLNLRFPRHIPIYRHFVVDDRTGEVSQGLAY